MTLTPLSNGNLRRKRGNHLAALEVVKDATVLTVEQSLTALKEGKDLSLKAEKDTLLIPLISGAGLPLKAEDYIPQVTAKLLEAVHRFALKVE